MADSGSEPQQPPSTYGVRAVWLLVGLLLFYPLSAGPIYFLAVLVSQQHGEWRDAAVETLQFMYSPVVAVAQQSPMLSSPFEQYMFGWAWLAEKVCGV